MILDQIADNLSITIQCHDNPDADTIASGFALYKYFMTRGKYRLKLIYSGHEQIKKKNLQIMVEELNIPIEYVPSPYRISGVLVNVDCQYGSGNVTRFPSDNIVIIDHHQPGRLPNGCLRDIRPEYGSCSTIIWKLLSDAGFDINAHPDLSTALYYGLYTDTGAFAEIYNPLDREMQDTLNADYDLIKLMNNSNLSLRELEIAGLAMIRAIVNEKWHFAILKADDCDSNILGLISDICLQVDTIHSCIVYAEHPDYVKFSVRSCIKEVLANELAAYIAKDIGNGGGHTDKAGGLINLTKYKEIFPDLHFEAFFSERYQNFFSD